MPLLRNHIAVVTGAGVRHRPRHRVRLRARGRAGCAARSQRQEPPSRPRRKSATAGGQAESFALDVAKREDCFAVAKRIAEQVGQVSILVNNAGINRRNGITADADAVLKDWQDIMSINLNGVFNVTHAFLAPLRKSKGRIVNIASIQSFMHVRTPNSPAYTTSKHGVLGFTRALAAELGKEGVRVNAIGPGLIETPLNAHVRATNAELVKIFIDHTPLGRAGKPEDIVGPALFLASDLVVLCHGFDRDGRWRLPDDLRRDADDSSEPFDRCGQRLRRRGRLGRIGVACRAFCASRALDSLTKAAQPRTGLFHSRCFRSMIRAGVDREASMSRESVVFNSADAGRAIPASALTPNQIVPLVDRIHRR